MKAFISYSHQDSPMLDFLHKHLKQLQRDGLISAWTDNEIPAGGNVNKVIARELDASNLFLALVSPDYIASGYCYELEFQKALKLHQAGEILILPIIIEPCDWLNTPFKEFKALPKDGKAISLWENKNTAFLDVVQNIRRVIQAQQNETPISSGVKSAVSSRNYRIQKDFDSLEKLEFAEKTFGEIKTLLKRYIDEVVQLDNIKARVLLDTSTKFECLLVNRNKIATESQLKITTDSEQSLFRSNDKQIQYSITNSKRPSGKQFILSFDEYRLFWLEHSMMYSTQGSRNELDAQKIAESIWNEWLESVGIL